MKTFKYDGTIDIKEKYDKSWGHMMQFLRELNEPKL